MTDSQDSQDGSGTICQIKGCNNSASGQYSRRMFKSDMGEEWPEDVYDRPICWWHHRFMQLLKAATAVVIFGLIFGTVWLGEEVLQAI